MVPGCLELRKRLLELLPAREREVLATRQAPRNGPRRGVQAAEHRPHAAPLLGPPEVAELLRRAVDERFHADRIARVHPVEDRSALGRDRRQDELQPGVCSEGRRRAKGPVEHHEDIIGSAAGVVPGAKVVGAHEPPGAIAADGLPVVATEADRQVVQTPSVDAPLAAEGAHQC